MRRSLVIAALTVVLATACTSTEPSTSPSTAASSVAPSSSSPAPTSASPSAFETFEPAPAGETGEIAAIRSGFEKFQTTMWLYSIDPDLMDMTQLNAVATGDGEATAWSLITETRAAGRKPVGDVRYYNITITPPATNAQGVRLSKVNYCADPTGLKVLDIKTGELVEGLTPTKVPYVLTMELMSDDSWRVSEYSDGDHSC